MKRPNRNIDPHRSTDTLARRSTTKRSWSMSRTRSSSHGFPIRGGLTGSAFGPAGATGRSRERTPGSRRRTPDSSPPSVPSRRATALARTTTALQFASRTAPLSAIARTSENTAILALSSSIQVARTSTGGSSARAMRSTLYRCRTVLCSEQHLPICSNTYIYVATPTYM